MKKRRLQRLSRNLLAVTFLVFCLIVGAIFVYVDIRGEYLLKDFKIPVEKALSQKLKTKVTIRDVRGGVFYPVIVSDIVIYSSLEGQYKQLEAEEVSINYHLWDLLTSSKKGVSRMRLQSPAFYLLPETNRFKSGIKQASSGKDGPYLWLEIVNGSIISGDSEKTVLKDINGSVVLKDEDADLKDFMMNPGNTPLVINGRVNGVYSSTPHFDLELRGDYEYAKVSTRIFGALKEAQAEGTVEVNKRSKIDFAGTLGFSEGVLKLKKVALGETYNIKEGYIDFDDKKFECTFFSQEDSSGEIVFGGSYNDPSVSLYGNLKHWNTGSVDLSTDIKLDIEIKEKTKPLALTGELETANTIINFRPSEELSMQFALRKNAIEILGLKWGKAFRVVGKFELAKPNNMEFIALLDGANLEEMTSFFTQDTLGSAVSGSVKGRLEVEGPLATCVSRGHITAKDGNLGDIYYENAVIHLVGKGSLITVGDSRIYRETGYLLLDGEIDLKKLGKRNVFEDVVVKTDDQSIVWEGWDISKKASDDEVNLKKRVNEEWEIGFTATLEDEAISDQRENQGEFELRYKLKDNDSLKLEIKEEEEILGVEHKIKF